MYFLQIIGQRRAVWRYGLFLSSLLLFGSLWAQETTGSIRGTVSDSAGLPITGATVKIISPSLVQPLQTQTDPAGAYLFSAVPPGVYTVSAMADGFTLVRKTSMEVTLGRTSRADFQLTVGAVSSSLEVAADAVSVDSQSSTQITSVGRSLFDGLPKDRGFDSLIALAPGARVEPLSGGFQIDGASGSENVFLIDGVDNTNLQTGLLPRTSQLPIEQIDEIQVKSGAFDAQFGGSTGGVVSAIIRSGSNKIHGQLSLYAESDIFQAAPRPTLRIDPQNDNVASYFHNPKDSYRMLNPGGSIGGPILKDKLWAFVSWYPEFRQTERTVTFLDRGESGHYRSKDRTDFLVTKVDYALTSKIRTFASYVYSPTRVQGLLPDRQGTDSFDNPWRQRGGRAPASSYNFGADASLTAKLSLSLRGGYNYRNFKDNYGVPSGTYYHFVNTNTNLPAELPIPDALKGSAGNFTADNVQNARDQQTRLNFNGDLIYLANWKGQHTIKTGYQMNRLHNDVQRDYWPDGNIQIFWDLAYPTVTRPGTYRGTYGYYIDRHMETSGRVSSTNHSIYLQDSWRVSPRLTLNLGLRTERESVPSFLKGGATIQFPFSQKLAPRLGVAWDALGDGRLKLFAGFGLFYDLMKYEASRVSFGGEKWVDYMYPLNSPDFTKIRSRLTPGSDLIESYDHRIPANDPEDNRIDPNLRPTRQRKYEGGIEFAMNPNTVVSARYTRQRLDRTIENSGVLGADGTAFYVANPGFGLAADPSVYPAGVLPPPPAKRDYDAVDFSLRGRYPKGIQIVTSYTWSRLYGDYSGLASSDEGGAANPNSTLYYDLPWMSIDQNGKFVRGRLATDRPHTVKFFGVYTRKSRWGDTTLSPRLSAFSGTPITTNVWILGDPVFVAGRGDLGRTPFFRSTDFLITHDFHQRRLGEKGRIRLEANVTNLFNHGTVTNKATRYNHPNDGQLQFDEVSDMYKGFHFQSAVAEQGLRVNPAYNMASSFQAPRSMRIALHFIF
ncbi:TonB-dependent receptor [Bryobacter aggregatus]|uniref:TonB-dependent receptor n=1 Tax=Bryobacter aggregatus TaxID=360054 RepID=UPI00138E13BC|nr:TonB-dependent receptor [Bryobacter aggregatus]